MDNQFTTTVPIDGINRKATCEYTTRQGRAYPYAVWIDGILYPSNEWKQQLTKEAQAVEDVRKVKPEQASMFPPQPKSKVYDQ